jgi:hypothetical protein
VTEIVIAAKATDAQIAARLVCRIIALPGSAVIAALQEAFHNAQEGSSGDGAANAQAHPGAG